MTSDPYYATADWSAISIVWGMGVGLVLTGLAAWLLPKAFPRLHQVNAFFWVMLCILFVTSLGSILILTPHQAQSHHKSLI